MPPEPSHEISYSENFIDYLNDLVTILYEQDYFGFAETAKKYTAGIIAFVNRNLHVSIHHPAPAYFSKYKSGMKYITYRSNKRTTWYIFFKQSGSRFLVYYITNNHYEGQYIR